MDLSCFHWIFVTYLTTMSATFTCIAIDDDPLYLRMLSMFLTEIPSAEVLGTYANPVEGVMDVVKKKPDVLFIDIDMPYLNGFETLETLDSLPKIIVISGHLKGAEHAAASQLDIAKFISKSDLRKPEDLHKAVEEVLQS